jgi:hypothetical protein
MFRSVLLGAACVFMGVGIAQARPTRSAEAEVQPTGTSSPVRPVSATVQEDSAVICTHARRRLWIENEGWVVRKVSTCR